MLFHVSLTISSRNTARHGWEDFAVDDDVWVFDPEEEETSGSSDADVEMLVNGDEDTSSGDEDGYDDASDDESMSSEDDSNEDDDASEDGYDILERLAQSDPDLTEINLDDAAEGK
jgi:hypothetical protein